MIKVECRNSGFYTPLLEAPWRTFGVHRGGLKDEVGNLFAHVISWVLPGGPHAGPSAGQNGPSSELS